jgi:uncharacterized protein
MSWFRREADGTLVLRVHAQPGARRTELAGLHGEALKVRVAAPPVEGRANEALRDFLAERCGVPRAAVTLLQGETGRAKRFAVRGCRLTPEELLGTG